jgi:hypothetical protein
MGRDARLAWARQNSNLQAVPRDFVRGLGLPSAQSWRRYCKSGLKPRDIPIVPEQVYRNSGWKSYSDWVGNGRDRNFLSFEKARADVHKLALNNETEWRSYQANGRMPSGIPKKPELVYKNTGWCGWADWLRGGRPPLKKKRYREFQDARDFVRALNLKSGAEWNAFCKSGNRPPDVPADPGSAYADDGWVSLGDWLGTGRIADRLRQYREFVQARAFVRSLGMKSTKDWNAYARSGNKPEDIPSAPQNTYSKRGWRNYGDWLGTETVATNSRIYLPFKEARVFVRGLGLKSESEWRAYCNSGKKPADIPRAVASVYANDGWQGKRDWLGTADASA